MSDILDQVVTANGAYVAEFGDRGSLALPPARGFAVLTCMDARLDPAKYAGLSEGDAHVIRNAGGRASDRRSFIFKRLDFTRHGCSLAGHEIQSPAHKVPPIPCGSRAV